MNKKTNKELFTALLSVIAAAELSTDEKTELTDFVNSRIEQIDKKANSTSKAQREKDAANAALGQVVLNGLSETNRLIKVSDLIKEYPPLSGYSTQKLTPILSGLIADGKVERLTVKRENLYRIKTAENATD